jgi:pimeloyl-ACP methyl ester carboxylesterase
MLFWVHGTSLRITMKRRILIFWCAMVGAVPSCQVPILAQNQPSNLPGAIFVDSPRDAANPTRNEAVWIPSGGVLMNGVMYAAAGAGNHPTVLNLHGTPGNEQNLDIAQTLRRAGYNVLSFHYRGSWGSPGKFTQAGGVEDAVAALAFLQDPAVAARFHIDTKRIIVIGHSYGGFAAARVAAAHPNIAALVLIAPWNPAQDIPLFTVPPEKFAAAAHSIFDDDEGRMGGYTDVDMAREILTPGYDWRLETSAEGIKNLPILIVSAKHDTADDQGTELVAALGHLHAADVTTISMDTDHPFSDHRIALEKEILSWLQQRTPGRQPAQILAEGSRSM